ncbi:uncharacterized protein [Atheta coriaria]|uniref:uncharacterized protein n=2 Tax=Dalotia coriaria TaxID=877792 RepID=UPI0031F40231
MILSEFIIISTLIVGTYAQNTRPIHPCKRECDGTSMTCKYHFQVETYYILDAMACYSCPDVVKDCYRRDCIVAGGIKRNIITVNRQFPGPPIEVCLNDTIEVLLENIMMNDESTTIHWHGQTVKENPYMDGVPFVTQCPVLSNNNFTYRLQAAVAGTHFWHSHEKMQRGDGMFGMLIVNVPKAKDPHASLYDEDLTQHQVSITDWTRKTRIESYGDFVHGGNLPAPDGILINGLGYMDFVNVDDRLPIAEFTVEKGKRYRFRFVNAEFFDCPFTVSFDNHKLTVISSDGHDVQPQAVDYFNIFAGERYDVILEANQTEDAYWMRVKGLEMCDVEGLFQVAILKYANSPNDRPTTAIPNYENAAPNTGLLLNPLLGDEPGTLLVNQLKAYEPMEDELKTRNVVRRYIKLSFNPVENPTSYRYPYYGFYNVSESLRIVTPEMNDIGYKDSRFPLLSERYSFSKKDFCNNETASANKNCTKEYCHCTHVVELPINKVVELVIYDNGVRQAHHPMHLHGFGFRVVAWKRLGNLTSRADIESLDKRGLITRNLKDPIKKDTIPVPRGGYAIVRFKTDNPGFWIFHCHVDIHADDGMRMVFKVGSNQDMKPVPQDFPKCRSYENAKVQSRIARRKGHELL